MKEYDGVDSDGKNCGLCCDVDVVVCNNCEKNEMEVDISRGNNSKKCG